MAKQIYRKSMLERMSSPDQLDKMIVITSPSFWLALLGGTLIVIVVLVWSIFGRLPINLEAAGIFVSEQTAYTLASDTGGIVATVDVAVGDQVQEGDVLMTLANDAAQKELSDLLKRRAKVEAVTLTSVNDEITADNRDLVNLKNQLDNVGAEGAQNQAMLSVYQAELASLRPRVNSAKAKMEDAKEDYYDYISVAGDVEADLEISQIQQNLTTILKPNRDLAESAMNAAKDDYQNAVKQVKDNAMSAVEAERVFAQQNLQDAENAWKPYEDDRQAAEELLNDLLDQKAALEEEFANMTSDMEGYYDLEARIDELEKDIADQQVQLSYAEEEANYWKQPMVAAQSEVNSLNALAGQIGNISATAAPNAVSSAMGDYLDSASYSYLDSLYAPYTQAVAVYEQAEEAYQDAVNAYNNYTDERTEDDVEKERLVSLYNQYSNEYSSLHSQMLNLQANITSIQGQLRAAKVGSNIQSDSYEGQFEATRAAILSSLDAEIEKYQFSLDKTSVRATVSGSVADIKVGVGSAVGQGSEIVTIRQKAEEDTIVCYIPISSGKRVQPGMEVIVTPTTVNRQEYGHMKAEVVTVDDYVTPASSIRSRLGDDMLAQAFTQSGPVIAVTCRLQTDETTASGYWWSNRKGSELYIAEGTLVTVDVVTEEKAPITMLIPYIKDKLTMAVEPGAGSEGEGR